MNRIDQLFLQKHRDVLAVYFTAGYPDGTTVVQTILELERGGADIVEVGIPFSDPLADGPVIQAASARAISNGMTIEKLFTQLAELRKRASIPVVLMGYLNPVLQFGFTRFLESCKTCGIDGVILPDLPHEEFEEHYQQLFDKYEVFPIFLISPRTPKERAERIAKLSKGFVYLVSSGSTTGLKSVITEEQREMLRRAVLNVGQKPVMVGFGIHDQLTFQVSTEFANGGIVGSAFIKLQESSGTNAAAVAQLMTQLKRPQYDCATR